MAADHPLRSLKNVVLTPHIGSVSQPVFEAFALGVTESLQAWLPRVTREAYSHEVSSCGFWPGGGAIAYPAFYSYAYPEPAGFPQTRVQPDAAFYSDDLHEFVLPYDTVRMSKSPDDTLLEFLQTTYEAAANLAKWDRASLERDAATIARGARRET